MESRIAELATQSSCVRAFRLECFALLQKQFGFDHASMQSTDGRGGPLVTSLSWNEDQLRTRLPNYMGELSDDEIRAPLKATVRGESVFGERRRDRVALYRDVMGSNGITSWLWRIWTLPAGLSSLVLGRTGATPFRDQHRQLLDRLLPLIQLGEGFLLLAARKGSTQADYQKRFGLSAREAEVAEQALRGLTASEIALLSGCSVHTVRNQIAAIYRKANVSTRAELAFVAASDELRSPSSWNLAEIRAAMERGSPR